MPRPCTASSIPGHTLSPCCGEAGEKEKERALSIFSIVAIFAGIPNGSLGEGESRPYACR